MYVCISSHDMSVRLSVCLLTLEFEAMVKPNVLCGNVRAPQRHSSEPASHVGHSIENKASSTGRQCQPISRQQPRGVPLQTLQLTIPSSRILPAFGRGPDVSHHASLGPRRWHRTSSSFQGTAKSIITITLSPTLSLLSPLLSPPPPALVFHEQILVCTDMTCGIHAKSAPTNEDETLR
jgi:hypothetical protein